MKLTLLSENNSVPPFEAEHGLSILLEYGEKKLLFDTGAGSVLPGNAGKMNIDLSAIDGLILSHGHRDHTGGLAHLYPEKIWHAPGITQPHYSLHPGKPVRNLTMPEECIERMKQCPCQEIDSFTEILPGIFLTGLIPRISGEDCGGPFFIDPQRNTKDHILNEQALLLKEGILIQGCCHAGLINTLEFCKKEKPEIRIHTVIGGLHLLLASDQRLKQTSDYLQQTDIQKLYLLHCTGENAIIYLKENLQNVKILIPGVDGKPFLTL